MGTRSIWMLGAVALVACEGPPEMHTDAKAVQTGTDVVVTFDERLSGRATNQYWVALSPVDAPVSDTTGRLILERADRVVHLRTSRPGEFEVRLHGGYPRVDHHLLARLPITVEGWPVKTGIEQRVNLDECLDRWRRGSGVDEPPCDEARPRELTAQDK